MNILHYLDIMRLDRGGPVRAVLDLCDCFAQRGHALELATFDDRDVPADWARGASPAPGRVVVTRLDPPVSPLGQFAARQTARIDAMIRRADVLHLHGVWTPSNAQLAVAARRANVPYVVSLRGMLDDWCMAQGRLKKRLYLALVGRRVLERAAAVHCTAKAELEQSSPWFPRGSPRVIPNLMNLAPYKRLPGPDLARERFPILRDGRPAILFLSRIHEKKGIERLLDLIPALRALGCDASCLIAGAGDDAYVDSLRRRADGLERVEFLGLVVDDLKLSLYQAADLFVLPTSQENFGFVLFEALACATPVVTTRGVDTWPELQESGGAEIVDSDAQLLLSAAAILADPAQRRDMGDAGRRWVLDHLDDARVAGAFEAMYRDALSHRTDAPSASTPEAAARSGR